MSGATPDLDFRRDPLGYLDRSFPAAGDAFWLPGRQLCLADPAAARAVLANDAGLYQDHSDFFFTRHGSFGPRDAQVAIGKGTRALLRPYLEAGADELAEGIARLAPESHWPDAGNRLVYRFLAAALVAPCKPGFRSAGDLTPAPPPRSRSNWSKTSCASF